MHDDSEKGGSVAAIGLILILLLLIGGGVAYFVMVRQSALASERALLAELEARKQAELALAAAEAAIVASAASDKEPGPPVEGDPVRAAVEAILRAQAEAWNRGDLDAFVEHYWKSDDFTFSAEGKTTRGWAQTVSRYRERYPTPEKMGRLNFDGLEVTPLGDSAALVLGKWKLERESEPLSGNFSLVFRKLDGRWVIVHDHTSRRTD
jgi:beta-aspartyl-peptidase (threonine type)